jgi:hypothetical protein
MATRSLFRTDIPVETYFSAIKTAFSPNQTINGWDLNEFSKSLALKNR